MFSIHLPTVSSLFIYRLALHPYSGTVEYLIYYYEGPFTLLTASHRVKLHSADLESSTKLKSGTVMRLHIPHHVHVDGINGSAG